ncbi:MAG: nickel pincer cofactor biosynthesis protein LarC [Thermodesulfobacteriota bacterium]|nr:nickel pincer cofactor biosynthesis protein LarC [Thermodesulfobacteriota bacterium]
MKILYFDCFSGVSGDMTLAALLNLGLPEEKLRLDLAKLGLKNYSLNIFQGSRNGIAAVGLEVKVGPREEHHRHFSDIGNMIESSSLEPGVKKISLEIFQCLAEAESRVHSQKLEEVHFHEVGAVDSIVDIVGTAIGIDYFQPEKIFSSELPMGRGFVQCQHGRLPLPAPATLEILKGYPIKSVEVDGELVTPTGAAIVAKLSSGVSSFPAMAVEKIGYGMGKKEFPDRPNLLRLVLGEATAAYLADRVIILEANIDDMNPEFYDYLMERLFEGGALDVSLNPLLMKKNRPGTLLRVIVEEQDAEALSELILRESTTLGVRNYAVGRKKLPREVREVETKYGKIRIKISGDQRFQPEYEDCKRIARDRGVPLQEVYREALKKRE